MTVPVPDDSGPDISGLLAQISESASTEPQQGTSRDPVLEDLLSQEDTHVLADRHGLIVAVFRGTTVNRVRYHRKGLWSGSQWGSASLENVLRLRRQIREHLDRNPTSRETVQLFTGDGRPHDFDPRDFLEVMEEALPRLVNLLNLKRAYAELPLDLQVDLGVLVTKHRTVPADESYAWSDPTEDRDAPSWSPTVYRAELDAILADPRVQVLAETDSMIAAVIADQTDRIVGFPNSLQVHYKDHWRAHQWVTLTVPSVVGTYRMVQDMFSEQLKGGDAGYVVHELWNGAEVRIPYDKMLFVLTEAIPLWINEIDLNNVEQEFHKDGDRERFEELVRMHRTAPREHHFDWDRTHHPESSDQRTVPLDQMVLWKHSGDVAHYSTVFREIHSERFPNPRTPIPSYVFNRMTDEERERLEHLKSISSDCTDIAVYDELFARLQLERLRREIESRPSTTDTESEQRTADTDPVQETANTEPPHTDPVQETANTEPPHTDHVQRTADTEPRTDFHGLLTFDEHGQQSTEPPRTEPPRESSYVPEQSADESETLAHAHTVYLRNLDAFTEWSRVTRQRYLDDTRAVQRSYLDRISRERDPSRSRVLHYECEERVNAMYRNHRRAVDEARARLQQQYIRLCELERQHRATGP